MTKQATIRSEWERFRDEVLDGDIPEGKPSEMAEATFMAGAITAVSLSAHGVSQVALIRELHGFAAEKLGIVPSEQEALDLLSAWRER